MRFILFFLLTFISWGFNLVFFSFVKFFLRFFSLFYFLFAFRQSFETPFVDIFF